MKKVSKKMFRNNIIALDLPTRLGFLESDLLGGILLFGSRVGNANIPMVTNISIVDIITNPEKRRIIDFRFKRLCFS